MIHADLKGVRHYVSNQVSAPPSNTLFTKANILIDPIGHARLADFGLLTIVSDPTIFTASSSMSISGTARWMSPELLDPGRFDLNNRGPTRESDCYALGMVIYEVLSGRAPFMPLAVYIATQKVLDGERPERPEWAEGQRFKDELWEMLSLCWATEPQRRPSVEAVLELLGRISGTWTPLPPQAAEVTEEDESDWTLTISTEVIPPVWFLASIRFTCLGFVLIMPHSSIRNGIDYRPHLSRKREQIPRQGE